MCYQPVNLVKLLANPTGEILDTIVSDDGQVLYWCKYQVPCGKCLDCLEKEATTWAHRIQDECSHHDENCMITLTYAVDRLSLNKRDLQLFLKRLRRHVEPKVVRFFACGEYGSRGKRPHYHVLIFGWRPPDLRLWKKSKKGFDCFLSNEVARLWAVPVKDRNGRIVYDAKGQPRLRSLGLTEVSDITLRSSKYSAKYLQKYQPVPPGVVKPFTTMSTHPGIGYLSIDEKSLKTDKIWHEGSYVKVPRYYLKKLSDLVPAKVEDVRLLRQEKGKRFKMSDEDLEKLREKREKILDRSLNPL